MFCGNAAGELMPPYVVYKSKNLWDTWTENGPSGTRYSNTSSGWFESQTFADWFTHMLLPRLKKIEGKKVVIGDNLSSHINVDVLDMCKSNDIWFVCLPPNSTHVTQPLDVALFGPMKKAWRQILSNYKESHMRTNVLEKQHFPQLLKALMEKIKENATSNLIAGFKKCGIVPCDVSPLLERISAHNHRDCNGVENSFMDYLEKKRENVVHIQPRNKKKLNVPAGQSIAHVQSDSPSTADPGTSRDVIRRTAQNSDDSEDDQPPLQEEIDLDDDIDEISDAYEDREFNKKLDDGYFSKSTVERLGEAGLKNVQKVVGEYVLFTYDEEVYPGIITKLDKQGALINSMVRTLKCWKWPEKKDEIWYTWDKIIGSIDPPQQISKRGLYSVPQCDRIWWK